MKIKNRFNGRRFLGCVAWMVWMAGVVVPVQAQTLPEQTIRGDVVDRVSRTPLPGANVVVVGTEPLLGTMTDAEGQFVIAQVPIGRHAVQVSFIGYEPVVLPEVLVTAGKEVVLQVALQEQVVQGDEVVVLSTVRKEEPINEMAFVSARSFTVEETRRYAGGLDDPARMASAYAGVTANSGVQDNALVIRGNAPKGVQWRLEGVEIPNPNHFAGLSVAGGGGVTLFSSQLLAASDVFTGAFPAEYGNTLAGVFDMRFRTGNPARREHAIQIGLLGIEVASEGPFVEGGAATYLFNYRYSTLGLLMPLLPTESATTYQDLSFKLNLPTLRAGQFEVWGLGGLDGQTQHPKRDSTAWEYEFWDRTEAALDLGVGALGALHHLVLGPRTYLRTKAALTVQHMAWEQQRLDDEVVLQPNQSIQSTTGRSIVGVDLNHKVNPRHVNRTGVAVQRLFYDLSLRAAPDDVLPVVTVADSEGSSYLMQGYTQSRFSPLARLSVNVGVHAQYFALTGHTTVEPRAGLRWQMTARQALSLGYGLHSQLEDLRIYFAQPSGSLQRPNRQLDFTKAHHAVLGYDRQLSETTRLKLETYFQHLFDVPVAPDSVFSLLNFEQDWTFDAPLVNTGAGRNYGVEATLERFLKDGYYYLITGSLFRARYRGGDGVWRSTRYDQRYAVNVLAGKEMRVGQHGNLLGINGRLVAIGGKRRSPVDPVASQQVESVVFDERQAFAEQLPASVVVDLTLTYRVARRRWASVWALQIKNVLVAKDIALDYNFKQDAVEELREGFPLPVLSYKVEF